MEEAVNEERYSQRLVGLAHLHQDVAKETSDDRRSSSTWTDMEVIVNGTSTASCADQNYFKNAQWYVTSRPTSNMS